MTFPGQSHEVYQPLESESVDTFHAGLHSSEPQVSKIQPYIVQEQHSGNFEQPGQGNFDEQWSLRQRKFLDNEIFELEREVSDCNSRYNMLMANRGGPNSNEVST